MIEDTPFSQRENGVLGLLRAAQKKYRRKAGIFVFSIWSQRLIRIASLTLYRGKRPIRLDSVSPSFQQLFR